MFVELDFRTSNEYADFGKIIEFIDKNTNEIISSYKSNQPIVYIPQMFIENQSWWFLIKFDKENSYQKLCHDNSVQFSL